ncbi:hypothetical protein ACFL2C_04315 [Patescibacteria group bacterium]
MKPIDTDQIRIGVIKDAFDRKLDVSDKHQYAPWLREGVERLKNGQLNDSATLKTSDIRWCEGPDPTLRSMG